MILINGTDHCYKHSFHPGLVQIEITGKIAEEDAFWDFMTPDAEEEAAKEEEEEKANKGAPIPDASSFFIFGPQNKFRWKDDLHTVVDS